MWSIVDSPIGDLRIVANRGAIIAIEFDDSATWNAPEAGPGTASAVKALIRSAGRPAGDRTDDDPVLVAGREQLAAYFAGELREFDLPLAPSGSEFQSRVWSELRKVGYGHTVSYGELARRLGKSNAASRAVGTANGANPIPIVIPCHRIVGADGSLTGYAGGLRRKQALLSLEQDALF
ncbi:MAG: methylated-DNA--[protein]-cysteine S-methyltransferase [Nocardioides sp.]